MYYWKDFRFQILNMFKLARKTSIFPTLTHFRPEIMLCDGQITPRFCDPSFDCYVYLLSECWFCHRCIFYTSEQKSCYGLQFPFLRGIYRTTLQNAPSTFKGTPLSMWENHLEMFVSVPSTRLNILNQMKEICNMADGWLNGWDPHPLSPPLLIRNNFYRLFIIVLIQQPFEYVIYFNTMCR